MKVLMVASGQRPGRGLLLKRAEGTDYVVAIDGGLHALHDAGILPQLIVGDLDSVDQELVSQYRRMECEFLTAREEKNETDAMLALDEAVKRGATEIIFLGATGGRIDHLLSNLMLLKRAYEKKVQLTIEDDLQEIELYTGCFEICGQVGQTVSIIPVNEKAVVNASGLYYPLDELELRNDKPRGVSNLFTSPRAQIQSSDFVFIMRDKEIKK